MPPETWFVTGSSGFFGGILARRLAAQGHQVVGIDTDPPTAPVPGVRHHAGDVRDRRAVRETMPERAHVVHAAAALPILRDRRLIHDVNVRGTDNVLDAAVERDARSMVFISTTAVYGLHDQHPIHEDIPLVPVGPYGKSKIEAEAVCRSYRDRLHVPILRPKTFLGPGRLGVFEILFDWIHDGRRIPLIGDGSNPYQLLHADDLVDAVQLTAKKRAGNGTFNVGAAEFGTLRSDLEPLFALAGHPPRFLPLPRRTAIAALWTLDHLRLSPLTRWHYGTMSKDSYVEVDRLRRIGWSPAHSNVDTLSSAYEWYHAHRAEVRSRRAGTTHTVAWNQRLLGLFKRFA